MKLILLHLTMIKKVIVTQRRIHKKSYPLSCFESSFMNVDYKAVKTIAVCCSSCGFTLCQSLFYHPEMKQYCRVLIFCWTFLPLRRMPPFRVGRAAVMRAQSPQDVGPRFAFFLIDIMVCGSIPHVLFFYGH